MDLQASLLLLFALFTAGQSLTCYECAGMTGSCSDQKEKICPSGATKCASLTTVAEIGPVRGTVKVKDCTAYSVSGSMNFGIEKTIIEYCNTDKCNALDAPVPSTNVPNGKTCYACDGKSCSNILKCSGTEDRCIKATGSLGGLSLTVKGCASKSVCDATASVSSYTGISCCEGNLCNGAQSVTQSLMILCVPLLSFILML